MADGELTLKLDDETARRLQAAADAAGLPVDSYAAELLSGVLTPEDWTEDFERAAEYDRTGESLSVQEWAAAFRGAVEDEVAKRR
jgi:hypothetical protein